MGHNLIYIIRIMHACCFRRDGKGGNVFGLSEQKDLPTQEDRDSFETKCRNVCIKDHPDQTNFKKRLEYYFQQADKDHSNTIEREEFDTLVEYTAEDARRHGFVPSLQQLYDGDVQNYGHQKQIIRRYESHCWSTKGTNYHGFLQKLGFGSC